MEEKVKKPRKPRQTKAIQQGEQSVDKHQSFQAETQVSVVVEEKSLFDIIKGWFGLK